MASAKLDDALIHRREKVQSQLQVYCSMLSTICACAASASILMIGIISTFHLHIKCCGMRWNKVSGQRVEMQFSICDTLLVVDMSHNVCFP